MCRTNHSFLFYFFANGEGTATISVRHGRYEGADDWRTAVNQDRKGAGYFISQTGSIKFDPLAYLRWRNADKVTSHTTVVAEWGRWLH